MGRLRCSSLCFLMGLDPMMRAPAMMMMELTMMLAVMKGMMETVVMDARTVMLMYLPRDREHADGPETSRQVVDSS